MLARFGRSIGTTRSYALIFSPVASHLSPHNVSPVLDISFGIKYERRRQLLRHLSSPSIVATPLDHIPYAIKAAGRHLEEQIKLKDLAFLKEAYLHLRQLLIAWDSRSNLDLMRIILPSPENVLRDAMVLLSTSPLKDHASLHISMYDDISSLFQVTRTLQPPLQFTASIMDDNVTKGDVVRISSIFEHFCHLRENYPEGLDTFDMGRVGSWMYELVKASRKDHANLLCNWVKDLHRSFRIQPSKLYQRYIIKAFLTADMPKDAWNWLVQMRSLSVSRMQHDTPVPAWISRLKVSFGGNGLSSSLSPSTSDTIRWIKPDSEDYDIFLNYFSKRGEVDAARLVMVQMLQESGDARPTSRSWHLLLAAVLAHPGCTVSTIREVLTNMELAGFRLSLDFLGVTSGRGSVDAWIPQNISKIFFSGADDSLSVSSLSSNAIDPLKVDVLPEIAPVEHIPYLESLQSQNFAVHPVDAQLPDGTGESIGDAKRVEFNGGVEINPLINNIISESQLDNPFSRFNSHAEIYKEVMDAIAEKDVARALKAYDTFPQTKVDFEMAYGLISLLCSASRPLMKNIVQALQVYEDLLRAHDINPKTVTQDQHSFEITRQMQYSKIFHTLIPALTEPSAHLSSYLDWDKQDRALQIIDNLLNDMKTRNIHLPRSLVSPIVCMKFRYAGNHREALKSYISLVSDLAKLYPTSWDPMREKIMVISPKGCHEILSAFAQLAFPSMPVAPAKLWLSLLSDLNSRGYKTAAHDYAIYLKAISDWKRTAVKSTWKIMGREMGEAKISKRMSQSARSIHQHIVIDAHIDPTPHLLNALINTYQYLGEFDKALEVFNACWVSNRFDAATAGIMFDACGNASQAAVASTIWSMLVRKGWKFNKVTLDTWIECLCRLGYVNLACNFVVGYMGRQNAGYMSLGDTRPDERTCSIVLKLAWTVGQNLAVKEKIKTYLPNIWQHLRSKQAS